MISCMLIFRKFRNRKQNNRNSFFSREFRSLWVISSSFSRQFRQTILNDLNGSRIKMIKIVLLSTYFVIRRRRVYFIIISLFIM